jgi:hypothetical protein
MAHGDPRIQFTKRLLAQSRVIARGRGIRDVDRLVRQYGGQSGSWLKKSSPIVTIGGRRAEVHWYEHHGLGRFEEKLKWIEQS